MATGQRNGIGRTVPATCAYCHNEGQSDAGASRLRMAQIEQVLARFARTGLRIDEIVLSGGKPTLHKQVGAIARLCQSATRHLSMDSHGGHPALLAKALPYLDELKLHVDAFDPETQRRSMGLDIRQVDASIRLAQARPELKLLLNHPLADIHAGIRFVAEARARGIDCKIIDLFQCGLAPRANWAAQGYWREDAKTWLHANGRHRLHLKSCEAARNPEPSFYIGTDGVRLAVDGPRIAGVDDFDPAAFMREAA